MKGVKIALLIICIVGAVLLTQQIVKAKNASATDSAGSDSAIDVSSKLLGSDAASAFAASAKLYANADGLRVRKSPSLSGEVSTGVDAGTYIGTTTGNETTADAITWVEVTLSGGDKAYVAKNFTYIIP